MASGASMQNGTGAAVVTSLRKRVILAALATGNRMEVADAIRKILTL